MDERRGVLAEYEEMCQWKILTTDTKDDIIQKWQRVEVDFTYSNGTVESKSKWKVTIYWKREGRKAFILIGLRHKDFDNTSSPKEGNFLATIRNLAGTIVFEGSPTSSSNFLLGNRSYNWDGIELTEESFGVMQKNGGKWSMTVTLSIKTGPLVDFYRMITNLENDKENSDVKIISSDGKEFFAYRWILSETSDVFNSMFKSDMEEKKTGVIKMDDLSGKTVKTLLHFIYTKEVGVEWSTPGTVEEFVYAVDKYQIQELKNFLDVNVGKVCCLQNAGNLLALAEKTGLKKAEVDILAFIRENCKDAAGYFELVKHTIIN